MRTSVNKNHINKDGPCVIKIQTDVPQSSIFRFENYWMQRDNFLAIVQHGWSLPTCQTDKTKIISAKFKNLRRVLKAWHLQLSNLKTMDTGEGGCLIR